MSRLARAGQGGEESGEDIRNLGRPLVVTLIVIVLGTGSYQSLLQLMSLIARVGPDQGLGYGLGAGEGALGLLFAAPAVGVVLGGTLAGWLAARFGPGAAVLTSTAIVVDATTTNSATGIYSYISITGVLFIIATVLALRIAQSHRHPANTT